MKARHHFVAAYQTRKDISHLTSFYCIYGPSTRKSSSCIDFYIHQTTTGQCRRWTTMELDQNQDFVAYSLFAPTGCRRRIPINFGTGMKCSFYRAQPKTSFISGSISCIFPTWHSLRHICEEFGRSYANNMLHCWYGTWCLSVINSFWQNNLARGVEAGIN